MKNEVSNRALNFGKKNDKKIKICNSSKLFKQILWEEIPKRHYMREKRLLEKKLEKDSRLSQYFESMLNPNSQI